jgi:hypothetical protein
VILHIYKIPKAKIKNPIEKPALTIEIAKTIGETGVIKVLLIKSTCRTTISEKITYRDKSIKTATFTKNVKLNKILGGKTSILFRFL